MINDKKLFDRIQTLFKCSKEKKLLVVSVGIIFAASTSLYNKPIMLNYGPFYAHVDNALFTLLKSAGILSSLTAACLAGGPLMVASCIAILATVGVNDQIQQANKVSHLPFISSNTQWAGIIEDDTPTIIVTTNKAWPIFLPKNQQYYKRLDEIKETKLELDFTTSGLWKDEKQTFNLTNLTDLNVNFETKVDFKQLKELAKKNTKISTKPLVPDQVPDKEAKIHEISTTEIVKKVEEQSINRRYTPLSDRTKTLKDLEDIHTISYKEYTTAQSFEEDTHKGFTPKAQLDG